MKERHQREANRERIVPAEHFVTGENLCRPGRADRARPGDERAQLIIQTIVRPDNPDVGRASERNFRLSRAGPNRRRMHAKPAGSTLGETVLRRRLIRENHGGQNLEPAKFADPDQEVGHQQHAQRSDVRVRVLLPQLRPYSQQPRTIRPDIS